MNALALFIAGVYLVAVSLQGNAKALSDLLTNEHGYWKWIGSALIIYWAWKYKPFGSTISEIAGIGLAAVVLKLWPQLSKVLGVKHVAS